MAKALVTINPTFKWAVIVNAALCVTTLIVMCAAAFLPAPSNVLAERLFTVCEKFFTLTAGAFVGLLGGRAGAGK
jgi:hypothetical protein